MVINQREPNMKSNVLLINPKISNTSQNRKVNAMVNITFPTSLGVLAGYLASSGIDNVNIVDEQIHPMDNSSLTDVIMFLQKPRIIGISVLTLNCGRAFELAGDIKKIDQEATIILGGIHPTVVTEDVLSKNGVDIVVRGEGEETLKELTQLLLDRKDYKNPLLV